MNSEFLQLLNFKKFLGLELDYLTEYLEIKATIINEEPLRVGRGRGEGFEGSDLPIVKDINNFPYIPGSSLKGVFRSWLESLYGPSEVCLASDSSLDCCSLKVEILYKLIDCIKRNLYGGFEIPTKELGNIIEGPTLGILAQRYSRCPQVGGIISNVKDVIGGILRSSLEKIKLGDLITYLQKQIELLKLRPCAICRVFGNKALASHISISDARPKNTDVRTFIRTRVAIDRFTQAALYGALFDYEFVPPGYKWEFKMIGWNINIFDTSDTSKLLMTILKHLSMYGLFIGGMRSVGHGLIKLIPEESTLRLCRVEKGDLVCEIKSVKEVI